LAYGAPLRRHGHVMPRVLNRPAPTKAARVLADVIPSGSAIEPSGIRHHRRRLRLEGTLGK
jgi:hypothetical protein